nr:unnamed protein product [Spirometra erinaceieuropaei]
MSTDIPGSNRTCWTSSDKLRLSNCTKHRPPASSSSSPPPTNSDTYSDPPLPSSFSSSSSSSSSTAPTTAAQATVPRATTDTDTTTSLDSSDEDQDYTCPQCDRTFTPHIGLVGHLRIHRTDTGELVPGGPIYAHRTRLHCPRIFRHRMGLFGHMRIHESGIDHNSDTPTTSSKYTTHSPSLAPSPCSPITITASSVADTDAADFTCPHCSRTFTSRIGLVGHLRIHHHHHHHQHHHHHHHHHQHHHHHHHQPTRNQHSHTSCHFPRKWEVTQRSHGQSTMTATASISHSSLLTGSDSGWGVAVGRESEVDDSAHFLLTRNNLTRLKLSRCAKGRGLEGCQLTG